MTDPENFLARVSDQPRFREAIRRFDEANAADPTTEEAEGRAWPRELLYAQRLTAWLLRLCPEPSEELRLAARCQHICRWHIPRDAYPLTRAGYLKWRTDLKGFHARKAAGILREVGYPETVIARVQALNLKKDFPRDPEGRMLEDALCLVFLEFQFADLVLRSAEDKMVNAVQKTWQKMTPAAQAEALKLPFRPKETELLQRALHCQPPSV